MDGLVDDLAEAEFEGDGAENVGVDGGEAPASDEEVDHSEGGGARGIGEVGTGLYDDPGVGGRVGGDGFAGLDQRAAEGLLFVELEAQGNVERALDAVDADFAVALGGVAVATTEERAGVEDGEIKTRAGAEFADVEVAAKGPGWARAELTIVGAGDAHDAEKGPHRNDGGRERACGVGVELPVEEIRIAELFLEKAHAFDNAGPSPAVVAGLECIDLQDVAGLGAFDPDRAGEGVDASAVDGEILFGGHPGTYLAAAGVDALEIDGVPGLDSEAWRECAVPNGVGGLSGQGVGGHDSWTLTVIWSSTNALRGSALTPTAARTWRPASPKICTSKSDAPLMMEGESANPGAAFT